MVFRRRLLPLLALACWFAFAPPGAAEPPPLADAPIVRGVLETLGGEEASLSTFCGKRCTILVFMSIECPVSNGTLPTIQRIADEHAAVGLRVVGVNPNAAQDREAQRRHREEYELRFPILRDPDAALARRLGVTVCPEVFLLDEQRRIRYRGRIDDRYVRRGAAARPVRSEDLALAVRQYLDGVAVEPARTTPIGCPLDIERSAEGPAPAATTSPSVTWTQDIAPILQRRCQECHRSGGIGPFSLDDYDDAVRWSEDIVAFTRRRQMPPWKPHDAAGLFVNDRSMPEREIGTLAAWVAQGCPRGDGEAPRPPRRSDDWSLGPPDLVIEMPEEYEVAAEGEDDYRCFVLPTNLDGDRMVRAIDVHPGNRRVVHHVILFIDRNGQARRLDERAPGPGYSTAAGFPGFIPTDGLGGWAPGNTGQELPAGMARLLPSGADIVMQVHYFKTGRVERDRTRVGVYFANRPVDRLVMNTAVTPGPLIGLDIPAGAERHEVRSAIVMPRDMLAVSVTPHMHLLGRDLRVTATYPDGAQRTLIDVQDWDFNWQERYVYREPQLLPQGTRLDLVAHYDNSEQNPYNPSSPPRRVSWGESTTEEMCFAFFELAPTEGVPPDQLQAPTRRELFEFRMEARRLAGLPDASPVVRELILRYLESNPGADVDIQRLLSNPLLRAALRAGRKEGSEEGGGRREE